MPRFRCHCSPIEELYDRNENLPSIPSNLCFSSIPIRIIGRKIRPLMSSRLHQPQKNLVSRGNINSPFPCFNVFYPPIGCLKQWFSILSHLHANIYFYSTWKHVLWIIISLENWHSIIIWYKYSLNFCIPTFAFVSTSKIEWIIPNNKQYHNREKGVSSKSNKRFEK